AADDGIRPGATGRPIPGYRAMVVDDDMRPLPPGESGRLAVRGPTGCRYLADERQKEYVRDGWNLTGDAYKIDEDGYFWFQARTDDMIISAGYNIAGPEVEDALLEHDAVAECAVIGAPDPVRGHIVKAFVVPREGIEGSDALGKELQDFVKQRIAAYKYPRAAGCSASGCARWRPSARPRRSRERHAGPAAARLAAPARLCERHRGGGSARVRRRPDRLGRRPDDRVGRSGRAAAADPREHARRAARGGRRAAARGAHDLVRHRQGRIPRPRPGDRRDVPRRDGPPLSGHGGGRGQGAD